MPTYDYACDACDYTFEVFEPITAQPQTRCPECKKPKLRRLFGPGGGLIFKGSGFYLTDYRSESYKKAAAADKPADSSASTSGNHSSAKDGSKPNGSAKTEVKSGKSAN